MTIVGNTASFDYDGTEHEATGYTVTSISNALFKESDIVFSGTAEAKRTDAGTTSMGLSAANFSSTNPNFKTVTFNVTDGSVTVNPIDVTVTIKGKTGEKTYDGTELKVTGYDVEIGNTLYKETDFTFSGTAEAARTDEGTTTMGLAASQFENNNTNFRTVTFEVTDGYAKINPVDAVVVTIVGNTASFDYDGTEHEATGYTVTSISNALFKESDIVFSGTAEAKRTDAGTTSMGLSAANFSSTNPNFKTVTFNVTDGSVTVNPIDVTVTIKGKTGEKTYDGTELKVTGYDVEIGNSLYKESDFTFSGKAEAARTNEGTTTMGLAASQFENTNTNFKTVTFNVTDGYAKINPVDAVVVTIVGNTASFDYDGTEHEATGYTVTSISNALFKESDIVFSGTAEAKRTDAGTTSMGLSAANFSSTNPNFKTVTFNVTDGSVTVNPIDVTVTIKGKTGEKTYDGTELKVTGYDVEIGNSLYKESDFTFSGKAEAARTNEGTTTMGLAASQFENTNTNFKTVTFNVTDGYAKINPLSDVTVTITEHSGNYLYDGTEKTVSGYDFAASSELYVQSYVKFTGDDTVSGTDAATYNMELESGNFTNTNGNFTNVTFNIVDGTMVINPRKVTLTSATETKVYDTKPLTNSTVTVSGDGFATGEGATYDVTGTRTEKGSSDNTFTYTLNQGTKAANYEITPVYGTLTVTPVTGKVTVTITENSGTALYDGTAHEVSGYTVKSSNPLYTESCFTFTGNKTVTGTDAGTYQMQLASSNFTNISANFADVEFVIVDGTLTINPRPVTLTSATASKQYDGTPLTAETVTVSEATETSGFVDGEGVESYANFASAVLPNETVDNTFSYTLKSNTKAGNYNIEVVKGTLTINPRTVPYAITVTANSGTHEYDATAFTVSGFKSIEGTGITGNIQNQYDGSQKLTFTLSNGATFTITGLTASRTETHVNPANQVGVDVLPYTGYEVPVTGTAVIQDENGNDVTSQFSVGKVPGVLTITPRAVTLTSASDTKKYDKKALTNGTVTVTSGSFANGDGATYNVTGSQTRIGSSDNRFTYTLTGGADPQDYCIEYVYGKLTVTPPDDYEIVEKSHEAPDGGYKLGDTITFIITVENIFDTDATVTLTEQEGVEFLDASGNKIGNTYPETTLAAGKTLTVKAVYTVQEKDLLNGSFTNNVSANISATLDKVTYKGKDEYEDTVKDLEQPDPELTVSKTTLSNAENPALGYATGEIITYEITVTNTGNLTIHDIQVSDLISTAEEPVELTLKGFDGTLAPNESVTFTFEHTVVEEDLGKTITNEAIATGKNDTEDEDYDGEQIPTDVDDEKAKTEDDTEPIRHGLTISKTITNPQEIYQLQTPILYEIVITNTGNVTEQNVTVEDVMINAAHSFRFRFDKLDGGTLVNGKVVFASLAPGETRVITCRYTIGGGDESNVVGNMATVSSDAVTTVSSEVVEAQVETQYTLHIIYVDENWQAVPGVGNYRERLSVGDHYNITSPVVEGYTANRKSVFSGEEGMPAEDVWTFVIYTKDPEEEQPTEPEGSDPTDPSGSEPTDPTYDLTPLPNDQTPLADVDLEGEHTCCIMHLLIMLVSMMLLGFYTSDRKKLQKSIFELQRALKSEGVTIGSSDEEKA